LAPVRPGFAVVVGSSLPPFVPTARGMRLVARFVCGLVGVAGPLTLSACGAPPAATASPVSSAPLVAPASTVPAVPAPPAVPPAVVQGPVEGARFEVAGIVTVPQVIPLSVTQAAPSAAAGLGALEVLSGLRLEAPRLGAPAYGRDSWDHWLDEDGDGCDTRDEVLILEAVLPPTGWGACELTGGRWLSAYDGVTTGEPSDFDVDHLVALEEAHRSGGWAWDGATKAAYANDLGDGRTLAAVSASSNRSKGSRDPAGWLPAREVCRYVGDWIAVKARWSLSVDAEEATELSDLLLGECAGLTIAPWGGAVG
jgi:hypothetical protein